MGNSPSTAGKLPATSSANFHPEVEVVQAKSFDAHYGEVKIVKDKRTSQQYIVKDVVSNTKQAFETDLRFYGERVNVKHPNVVSVLGYTSEDKHNFCSTYYKISIFIEPLDHHLQTDFESRKAGKVYYTENELLTIADNLISGLSYFESQGHSHGDIRPFNIFSKDRTFKLSDPSLTPQKGYNALNLAVIQGAKTLLAPEWLQQVPHSNLEIKGNKSRADVYSLGQTLLALATLLNSEDAYDYKHGTISQNLVKERLQLVANRYSDFTYHLIKDMLIVDPANRPDFVTLSNRLLPYQHDIRGNAHLAFFDQHHQHHDHHGYHHDHHDHHHDHHHHHHEEQIPAPVVQHHGEVAKRSALPVDVHTTTVHHTPVVDAHHDDLDARIRAALDRSAATFKTIETKDHHDSHYTPAYTSTQYTSTYAAPHHVDTYTPAPVVQHHGEVAKRSAVPVDTHHVDVAPTTSYHHTSTYVPTTYNYSTYTAPTTTYTHTPVVDVRHSHHNITPAPVVDVHHVDRSAEVERIVKASQHFGGDVHKSYVAPVADVHHSNTYTTPVVDVHHSNTYATPVVDVHHSNTYTTPVDVHHSNTYTAPSSYTAHYTSTTPVVDVHHSSHNITPAPVTDVHHVDRSAEVERIVKASQHFNPEPAHHTSTSYSYSTYTAPASYSTYTPATYTVQSTTTPVVDVHHSHHNIAPVDVHHSTGPVVVEQSRTSDEHVVRSTPKNVEYNLHSSSHGAPASYTTTTYSNGHHYTPTDIHYSSTTPYQGGDVHHDVSRTVEYHH